TFQTTPRAYLMRMRIIHACSLLLRTPLPITEVALQSGFYDHSDFARQFQRLMGLSASAYRKSGDKPERPS
ncbi:MAG: helix-turn-helix transcriptional regulator, partial [Planctomycetes bacterium]|nr:helix-turn-helix transcriptional regulator [Planctomycetota bacterium]